MAHQLILVGAPIWRVGANQTTRLKTETDLMFGGQRLAAGEYSVFADLEEGGYLVRRRVGRGNHYSIKSGHSLRHPLEEHCAVDDLLALIVPEQDES